MLLYGRNGRLLENHAYILTILIKLMSSGVSIDLQLTKSNSEEDQPTKALNGCTNPMFFAIN